MRPILLTFGPVIIYTYGFFLLLAFLAGIFFVWKFTRKEGLPEEKIMDGAFTALFFGLLAGRITHILLFYPSFGLHPLKWLIFTYFPGFSLSGGMAGAVFGLYWFCRKLKLPFLKVADIVVFGFLPAYIIGDIGSFLSVSFEKYPVALFEALILFLIFLFLRKKKKDSLSSSSAGGTITLWFLFLYGLSNFLLDFFRESGVYWFKINIGQIVFLVLGIASGIILWRTEKNMFKFPAKLLKPVVNHLKRKEKETKKQLQELKKEDPFADTDRLLDNAATDTEVKEQIGHERIEALTRELTKTLVRIRKAMTKIKIGKYGICERCGKMIDTDRLAVMPTADLCVACEKEREK